MRICLMPQCQTTAGCKCQPPLAQAAQLALVEALRHIDTLTRFYIDNPAWMRAAEEARAFSAGMTAPPQPEGEAKP